jgi:hypothetical protein
LVLCSTLVPVLGPLQYLGPVLGGPAVLGASTWCSAAPGASTSWSCSTWWSCSTRCQYLLAIQYFVGHLTDRQFYLYPSISFHVPQQPPCQCCPSRFQGSLRAAARCQCARCYKPTTGGCRRPASNQPSTQVLAVPIPTTSCHICIYVYTQGSRTPSFSPSLQQ